MSFRNIVLGCLLGCAAMLPVPVSAGEPPSATVSRPPPVRYLHRAVDGVPIFYREAGSPDAPVIVLLHGFPSSSSMYRDLIPKLAPHFRVIAPDYPGFGHSATPPPASFDYSFANIAATMDRFLAAVGATCYILYMQDYGGPVGFRIAAANPARVAGLVIQNANAYLEGFGKETATPLDRLWREGRSLEADAAARTLFSPDGIRQQYVTGARSPDRLSPDSWTTDIALIRGKDRDEVNLRLLQDYPSNIRLYPAWQKYLRTHRPRTLIAWGANDPIFTANGARAYLRDVPKAELVLLDSGHFALEDHAAEIAGLIVKNFAAGKNARE